MGKQWSRGLWLLCVGALVAACDSRDEPGPNGTATIVGSALERDFSFAAQRVFGFFERGADGLALRLQLCEADCDFGLTLQPESRALSLNFEGPETALVVGAGVTLPELSGLAAMRTGTWQTVWGAFGETQIVRLQRGTVTLDAVELRQGGRVAGRFDLEFDDGGALLGSFDVPLGELAPAQ